MRYIVSFVGNLLWKVFGGAWLALLWGALAILFACTIVGFPLAINCAKIALVSWKPTVRRVGVNIENHILLNLIWCVLFGIFILPLTLLSVLLQIATIVGVPLVLQWYKVLKANLFPFGVVIK